jgi:leucyl aminopeptidase
LEFSIRASAPEKARTGCLVAGVFQGEAPQAGALSDAARAADRASGGRIRKALSRGDLSARVGSTLLLHALPGVAAERVLLVGLGEKKGFGEAAFLGAVRAAANALKELGSPDAVLAFAELKPAKRGLPWVARHAVLGFRDAFYAFDAMKTRKKSPSRALKSVTLALASGPVTIQAQQAVKEASATADGVALAKTLGNLPPNICTPSYLADEARKLAREFKLTVEVLEQKDMEKLGMGALLSVTRGSRQPPKLIVLKYAGGAKKARPLVLVGKGITFDTGGISLKPGGEMDEMKFDMSGAGSVLGAMRALAGMRAAVNVIAIVPTCENMPGGNATRPGDIVTTMSGQTVEILNTDAEGRLILCDALTYAERFSPSAVIDVATLTGACVVALGHVASGLFANDQKLADAVVAAADDAWDRVWQLPVWTEYQEQLQSNFADFANIGGRPAGSVTAACYLARFTEKLRWAHLDIAGTAWKHGREAARAAAHAFCAAPRREAVTGIDFYFNAQDRLQVACRLAAKACARGNRMLVYAPQAELAQRFDKLLWTFQAVSFVPHCMAHDAIAPETPVLIAMEPEPVPGCEVLLNLADECAPRFESYERVLEVVSADGDDIDAGRARYRFYKHRGFAIANHDLAGGQDG